MSILNQSTLPDVSIPSKVKAFILDNIDFLPYKFTKDKKKNQNQNQERTQQFKLKKADVLHEHLANFCKQCPNEISLYYAEIVRKKKSEEEENCSEEEYPNPNNNKRHKSNEKEKQTQR